LRGPPLVCPLPSPFPASAVICQRQVSLRDRSGFKEPDSGALVARIQSAFQPALKKR